MELGHQTHFAENDRPNRRIRLYGEGTKPGDAAQRSEGHRRIGVAVPGCQLETWRVDGFRNARPLTRPFFLTSTDASLKRLSRICAFVQDANPNSNAGGGFA